MTDVQNTPFYEGLEYPDPKVRNALVDAFLNRHSPGGRVRIWYGDTVAGRAWQEEYDVLGYVDRSGGTQKIPLLVYDRRSTGGGAILQNCVVRIDWTDGSGSLYKHPTFSSGFEHARIGSTPPGRDWGRARPFSVVNDDGEYVATFATEKQAQRWLEFMQGRRYAK